MSDQPALLPGAARHEAEIVQPAGPLGGPTRRYRGARLESTALGTQNILHLPGCPMDGANLGNWENLLRIVDAWLDHGTLPQPYRIPEAHRLSGHGSGS
jgi:hypothetical protein